MNARITPSSPTLCCPSSQEIEDDELVGQHLSSFHSRYWQTWAFLLQNFLISDCHTSSSQPLPWFSILSKPGSLQNCERRYGRLRNLLRILLYFLNFGELWVCENVICFHVLVHSHTLWREVSRNTETKPLKDMSVGFLSLFLSLHLDQQASWHSSKSLRIS